MKAKGEPWVACSHKKLQEVEWTEVIQTKVAIRIGDTAVMEGRQHVRTVCELRSDINPVCTVKISQTETLGQIWGWEGFIGRGDIILAP